MASVQRNASLITRGKTEVNDNKGKSTSIRLIKMVANVVGLTTAMTKETTNLLEQVYDVIRNRHRKSFTKLIAGSCICIICQRYGLPVMLRDVAELVKARPMQLQYLKRQIALQLQIPDSTVADNKLEAKSTNISISKTVEDMTESIIHVCRKAVMDYHSDSVVFSVASYLAWQAEEPVSRRTVSRKNFCEKLHLPCTYNNRWHKIWVDMQNVLCLLARQIPWVNSSDVEPANIVMYIKDVCVYQRQLMATTSMKELVQGVGMNNQTSLPSEIIPVHDVVVNMPGTFDPYIILVINNPD